jgi:bacteriocin-like protein
MQATAPKPETLTDAKNYKPEIQTEQEILELTAEELKAISGGVCVGLLY